jgi:hypothetical protein
MVVYVFKTSVATLMTFFCNGRMFVELCGNCVGGWLQI